MNADEPDVRVTSQWWPALKACMGGRAVSPHPVPQRKPPKFAAARPSRSAQSGAGVHAEGVLGCSTDAFREARGPRW